MQKKTILGALFIMMLVIAGAAGIILFNPFTSNNPDKPSEFTYNKISSTRIELSWVKAKNADTTIIERNNISSWKRGEGTQIYNDTGEYVQDYVIPNSHIYYQAWSWNQTKHTYSDTVSATTNTTPAPNQPPEIGTSSPINGSRNLLLSFTWSIYVSDPEGNPFTWTIQCNNGQTNTGTSSTNGTKTITLTNLKNSTTYTVWVNATDPAGSGRITRRWYTFTTLSNQSSTNQPPTFGSPYPANGTTGTNLGFTWGLLITDPELDAISFTIHCSNKQIVNTTGAAGGIKTITLTSLKANTTFKIWVNATDPLGSRQYTRRWYTFTTGKSNTTNQLVIIGTPIPANNSPGNPLNFTWSIPIKDPEGDTFAWEIQCHGKNTSGVGTNGTKTITFTNLTNATTYKVWVNATDSTDSARIVHRWFKFTTQTTTAPNKAPQFSNPTPGNNSINNPTTLSWVINITDPEGNVFNWVIQCSNGQNNHQNDASNGTKTLSLSGLKNGTTYKVWVNATDPLGSNSYTRRWYTFTTKTNHAPTIETPNPANGSKNVALNPIWTVSIKDQEADNITWEIQCSNGQTNSSTNATNGTKTLSLKSLTYNTTYKVWVNATDPAGSGLYTRKWFTFTTLLLINHPPNFGTPAPKNNSNNVPLNLTWSIPINDTEGDRFTWSIQCSNGQRTSDMNDTNGTKALVLNNLSYETPYTLWVNATDPAGSGKTSHARFKFITMRNPLDRPPADPTITGKEKGKVRVDIAFNITTTDPENDTVYYYIKWGDTTNTTWLGPYNSGEIVMIKHNWTKRATYNISAKAMDKYGNESGWTYFSIKMPFVYPMFPNFWERLFIRFPHAFPILRYLMGYE